MANKLHIKKDDLVVVISGTDKGKSGKVLAALPKEDKVIIESVNMISKHTKPKKQGEEGGIIKREAPVFASNVMLLCKKCNKATRIAYKILPEGKKQRVCKKCGAAIE